MQNNKSVLKSIHAFFEILSLKREFALFIRYSGGHVCWRWGFNIRVPNVSLPYMYFDLWLYLWNNSVYKFPISFYDNSAFLGVSAYCNCFHDIPRHRSPNLCTSNGCYLNEGHTTRQLFYVTGKNFLGGS